MTDFHSLTGYSHAVAQSVEEGERAYNGYREDSCSLSRHLQDSPERPLWLPIPNLHTSTYGMGGSESVLIETNEAAAIAMCDERNVDYGYVGCTLSVLVADIGETTPNEKALGVITELVEALENYPLLDEDSYSQITWEKASEEADSEVARVARKLIKSDEDIANRLGCPQFEGDIDESLAADSESLYEILSEFSGTKQGETWIGQLWEEEDCWPQVDEDAVVECIRLAFPLRTNPSDGTPIPPKCPETLELF